MPDLALTIDIAISGILTGFVYALMALGLSVIFGVIRVVNFAHGEMMVLAMFASVFLFTYTGLDPLFSIPFVTCIFFAAGYALQRYLIDSFMEREEHEQFILLLAVGMLITNGLLIVFGPEARGINTDYSFDSYVIGPVILEKTKLISSGAASLLSLLLFTFFRFTSTGTAIRACADNPLGAAVVGLNVKRLYGLAFGIGTACVGAAGCLMSLLFDVTPNLGPQLTLLSFTIVIIGGMGNMTGALLGGLLIGLSESLAGLFTSPSMKSMFSFALLIFILVFRPKGLLGK
ncbi:MAG: branched-chain amino acid ABC transporter permease [Alphaproteobacteria bacterium]|nr:branched-chain amino acid ABC transporter permease [Alphaproteobacteria bacterium]